MEKTLLLTTAVDTYCQKVGSIGFDYLTLFLFIFCASIMIFCFGFLCGRLYQFWK